MKSEISRSRKGEKLSLSVSAEMACATSAETENGGARADELEALLAKAEGR